MGRDGHLIGCPYPNVAPTGRRSRRGLRAQVLQLGPLVATMTVVATQKEVQIRLRAIMRFC